jgi:hypothetical protein
VNIFAFAKVFANIDVFVKLFVFALVFLNIFVFSKPFAKNKIFLTDFKISSNIVSDLDTHSVGSCIVLYYIFSEKRTVFHN